MVRKKEEQVFTRNQLVSSLLKIKHAPKGGLSVKRDNVTKLMIYADEGLAAARTDADLFGHLIAWNHGHSQIRDSKVAFPVLALRGVTSQDRELAENAIAHLLKLDPRELRRAYEFNHYLTYSQVVTEHGTFDFNKPEMAQAVAEHQRRSYPMGIGGGFRKLFQEGIRRYLAAREESTKRFDKTVIQFRGDMKYLYKVSRMKPSPYAQQVLFEGNFSKNSVFAKVANLSKTPAKEAAGIILEYDLPLEVIVGAFQNIKKEQDVILAMIEGMSGNQIIDHTEMLQKLGVMANEVLKSAYEAAIVRAKSDKKVGTLKAGRAAERQASQGSSTSKSLKDLQEVKLDQLRGIEGNWAVFGDRSSSMSVAIEMARHVAAFITQGVKGSVYLVFFNEAPTFLEVTGLNYDEILAKTRTIQAGGGTSIGCAMDYLKERNLEVNGIVIASDGGEWNPPSFADAYKAYGKKMGIEPTAYLLHLPGSDPDNLSVNCQAAGVPIEKLEMSNADHYALPNVLSVIRANRYQLFDDIMATPLLTFNDVFDRQKERSAKA